MSSGKALVIGANGFLGSHVTRQLVAAGEDVRVMVRRSSATRGIDELDVERWYGDIFDDTVLREAMTGCDVVYYCVVDARMYLRDPAPLFRTNVEGLRHVLDAAVDTGIARFVFTSTIGTLAISDSRLVTEDDKRNWTGGGPYIDSRVAAEELVMRYAREKGLPAVALCISTTYGPGDWAPTPHGGALAEVGAGKMPINLPFPLEIVGIEDAARAMLLAAVRGRTGERYIISDSYMSSREVNEIAAKAVGVKPPRLVIPGPVVYAGARLADLAAKALNRDLMYCTVGMRIADLMSPLDHSKAERELGWKPEPVQDSITKAARFFAHEWTPA